MRSYDEQREREEEAMFACLMEQVAQVEGERAVEEDARLQNDPAAQVPQEEIDAGLKTIRRQFRRRRVKVFYRSTLRQPVRSLLLLLLIAALTFAFVVRALEYRLIDQAATQAGSYYRAIGYLEQIGDHGDPWAVSDYLEANRKVKQTERSRWATGTLENGLYNADVDGSYYGPFRESTSHGITFFGSACPTDVVFYGTMEGRSIYNDGTGNGAALLFRVDQVVAGYPEYISQDKEVTLLLGPDDVLAVNDMAEGGRYLVRGTYDPTHPFIYASFTGIDRFLMVTLSTDGPWYISAPNDLDLTQLEYALLQKEIRMIESSQRGLSVSAVQDMSALPDVQESSHIYYLRDGRWLTSMDTEKKRRVCVIRDGFADARDIAVGDTITLEVRNIDSDCGYISHSEDLVRWDDVPMEEITFEVVGIAGCTYGGTYLYNQIWIPVSVLPEDFAPLWDVEGTVSSFELTTPALINDFLIETEGPLKEMGYRVIMLENNWEVFDSATSSIRQAAVDNVRLFIGVLLLGVGLVEAVYFRFRRKDIAISRALGVPVGKCVRSSVQPLALVGAAGAVMGGLLAWRQVSEQAAALIEPFTRLIEGVSARVPITWVLVLCGAEVLLIAAVAAAMGLSLARQSPLELLQGEAGTRGQTALKTEPAVGRPQADTVTVRRGEGPRTMRRKKTTARSTASFALRHIWRSPVKSVLMLLLTGAFVIGGVLVQITVVRDERDLESLYAAIEVTGEVRRKVLSTYVIGERYISQQTIDRFLGTGFIKESYSEGAFAADLMKRVPLEDEENESAISVNGGQFVGIDGHEAFAAQWSGRGKITWQNGYDATIFDGGPGKTICAVIAQEIFDLLGLDEDHLDILVYLGERDQAGEQVTFQVHIAGMCDVGENVVLIPLSAMKTIAGKKMAYRNFTFILAAEKNRAMEQFRQQASAIVAEYDAGNVALTVILWDQQLRQAVEPLEKVLDFMKTIYPVVVVLSAVLTAGLCALLVTMTAKNAAILRVLGTGRGRVRLILCLEVLLPCAIGLLAGCALADWLACSMVGEAAQAFRQGMLESASLDFAAAAVSAAVTSVIMTIKNPLELLQVKE